MNSGDTNERTFFLSGSWRSVAVLLPLGILPAIGLSLLPSRFSHVFGLLWALMFVPLGVWQLLALLFPHRFSEKLTVRGESITLCGNEIQLPIRAVIPEEGLGKWAKVIDARHRVHSVHLGRATRAPKQLVRVLDEAAGKSGEELRAELECSAFAIPAEEKPATF